MTTPSPSSWLLSTLPLIPPAPPSFAGILQTPGQCQRQRNCHPRCRRTAPCARAHADPPQRAEAARDCAYPERSCGARHMHPMSIAVDAPAVNGWSQVSHKRLRNNPVERRYGVDGAGVQHGLDRGEHGRRGTPSGRVHRHGLARPARRPRRQRRDPGADPSDRRRAVVRRVARGLGPGPARDRSGGGRRATDRHLVLRDDARRASSACCARPTWTCWSTRSTARRSASGSSTSCPPGARWTPPC